MIKTAMERVYHRQGESVAYMDEKRISCMGKTDFLDPEMKIDWCELGGNLA